MQMTIDLPATLSAQEVRESKYDLAVLLYQRGAASLGKAATLAGLTRIEFQHILAQREVPINYNEADLAHFCHYREWLWTLIDIPDQES